MKVFVWEPGEDDDREAWPTVAIDETPDAAREHYLELVAQEQAQEKAQWAEYVRLSDEMERAYEKRTGRKLPKHESWGEFDARGGTMEEHEANMVEWRAYEKSPEHEREWGFRCSIEYAHSGELPAREPDATYDTDEAAFVL